MLYKMLLRCLKFRKKYRKCKHTDFKVKWDSKKSKIFRNKEEIELLNKLGVKIPLSNVPMLGDVSLGVLETRQKMNEIVNSVFFAGDNGI